MSRSGTALALLVAAVVTTGAVGVGTALRDPVAVVTPTGSTGSVVGSEARGGAAARSSGPAAVLAAWDRRRAAAWARGDRRALAELYVDGSAAGRRDVAMLARWTRRDLVVRGLRMDVLGLVVADRSPSELVLDVTDRVGRALAVGTGVRLALPTDAPSRRRVSLRRVAGEWRVASVRPHR